MNLIEPVVERIGTLNAAKRKALLEAYRDPAGRAGAVNVVIKLAACQRRTALKALEKLAAKK